MTRKEFVLITAIFAMLVIMVFASGCLEQRCVECDGTGTIPRELRYQVTDTRSFWEGRQLWTVVSIKNIDDTAGTFTVVVTSYDDNISITRSSEARIGRGVTQDVHIHFGEALLLDEWVPGRWRYTHYVVPEIIHPACPECRGTGTVSVIPFSL